MDLSTQRLMMGAAGSAAPTYVENVFSTWLYTGNGSTQTITNGIDLSGKGGLVWIKNRNDVNGTNHFLLDTSRGANNYLISNSTAAQGSLSLGWTFNSDGFTQNNNLGALNLSSNTYASWTFRKAAKFFDVVTFTQPGAASGLLTVSHSLGSTPGCIIVKRTSSTSNWPTYHRSIPSDTVNLNLTSAASVGVAVCQNVSSTSFDFDLTSFGGASGSTYVAYLFAHDAGGFGDSGNDNVISCGSYTGNGSTNGPTITLGWEPQWIMLKRTSGVAGWYVYDNMRGVRTGGVDSNLLPNSSQAEDSSFDYLDFNATGFKLTTTSNDHNGNGDTYIYIAIRRGPMKTPTDSTKVFSTITSSASSGKITAGFAVDTLIAALRSGYVNGVCDRLRGVGTTSTEVYRSLITYSTAAENTSSGMGSSGWDNTGFNVPGYIAGGDNLYWSFGRAPGFFDMVAYTGSGANRTLSHNLGVVPELMIVKSRSAVADPYWVVYSANLGGGQFLWLNGVDPAYSNATIWNNTAPTSSVFSVGTASYSNQSNGTYIAYLFASCPGVSKVGNYTGTGTTLQINCGFTAGARFVLIKRTDSSGGWYAWDSARGIVSGNDPYVLLNSSSPEVTNTDYIDPLNSGFEISSTAPAAINANGGSFIFLAIA